jgi:hypothetical protein
VSSNLFEGELMETTQIIVEIDVEIARLQQVRALLSGDRAYYGRSAPQPRRKRTMSAEGRARIAAAQKARWAAQKKAAKKAA